METLYCHLVKAAFLRYVSSLLNRFDELSSDVARNLSFARFSDEYWLIWFAICSRISPAYASC